MPLEVKAWKTPMTRTRVHAWYISGWKLQAREDNNCPALADPKLAPLLCTRPLALMEHLLVSTLRAQVVPSGEKSRNA